jgi:hypothetical protein
MAQRPLLIHRAVFAVSVLSLVVSYVPIAASPHVMSGNRESVIATYRDEDAYAIYALFLQTVSHAHPVVQTETTYEPKATLKSIGITGDANFRKVWGAALLDYVARCHTPMLLTRAVPTSIPYDLLPLAEFQGMVKSPGGWDNFYKEYPESGGYISFSAVGFDSARTHAVAYMGTGCGMLCGFWGPRFFEKQNGKWAEVSVKAHYFNMVS